MPFLEFLSPIFGVVDKVVDRLVPDKALAAQLKAESQRALVDAQIKGELAQIEVNKIEAQSASIFVAGWRPFIGWVCGSALAYQFVAAPIATWVATWAGFAVPTPPQLDAVLWELVFGMLGMGTLRTFEKVKGVAR